MFNLDEINLSSFDLTEWVPVQEVKDSIAIQLDLDKLTPRQWNQVRKTFNLISRNISGVWYVKESVDLPDEQSDPELPLTSPSVYHFERFETSLAVINSPGSTITHNSVAPSAITRESDEFVQQVQSLGSFLESAEQFLDARSEQIEQALRVKEQAVRDAKLQIVKLKATADLAAQRSIEASVLSNHADRQLGSAVVMGKSIHSELSELDA